MLIAATRKALAGQDRGGPGAGSGRRHRPGGWFWDRRSAFWVWAGSGRGSRAGFGLGLRDVACDPYVDAGSRRRTGRALVESTHPVPTSDVVVVLTTLTAETRHIVNADRIALMKPGGAIINIGRGGCMDEAAVIAALDAGHLAAVAIDAWEAEPPPADHRLRNHPAVIATSHDVGHSEDLYARIPIVAAENTLAALAGQVPPYLHNPVALPALAGALGPRLPSLSSERSERVSHHNRSCCERHVSDDEAAKGNAP